MRYFIYMIHAIGASPKQEAPPQPTQQPPATTKVASSAVPATPPVTPATPPAIQAKTAKSIKKILKFKRKPKPRVIIGFAVLILVIVGTTAGLILNKISQDIRQKAAVTYPGTCFSINQGCPGTMKTGSSNDCESCGINEVCCIPADLTPTPGGQIQYGFTF